MPISFLGRGDIAVNRSDSILLVLLTLYRGEIVNSVGTWGNKCQAEGTASAGALRQKCRPGVF